MQDGGGKAGPTAMNVIDELRDRRRRTESVLIFYGTGINLWQYFPFLQGFAKSDLDDFAAIYGISGGAVCPWYYGLTFNGMFESSRIVRFDEELRSLNPKGLCNRIWRLATNKFLYDSNQLVDRIESFASRDARKILFRDYPLKNFTAIGYDDINSRPLFLNHESHGAMPMSHAMAALSFPRRIFGRRMCKPIDFEGFGLTDLDFAPKSIRKEVMSSLRKTHNDRSIYICNLFRDARKDNVTYIKCGYDRYPRVCQLLDLLLLLLNIPNHRLRLSERD